VKAPAIMDSITLPMGVRYEDGRLCVLDQTTIAIRP
jgi:hypothetical protein